MKIYDKEKQHEIFNPNLDLGYLQNDKLFIKHYDYVEEQGHYETIKEYANGGKDLKWVIDIPGVEEHDEFEDIQIYIPYTERELAERQIWKLKLKLNETDYEAIKFAEGAMSAAEYAPYKADRAKWRAEINELEKKL